MPKTIGYPVSLTTDVSGKDLSLFTERRQTVNRPDGQLSVSRAGKPVLFINLQFLAESQERAGDVNAEKESETGLKRHPSVLSHSWKSKAAPLLFGTALT